MKAETGVMQPQPWNSDSHQKLGEARNRFAPRAFGGEMALPTP